MTNKIGHFFLIRIKYFLLALLASPCIAIVGVFVTSISVLIPFIILINPHWILGRDEEIKFTDLQ